MRLKLYKMSFQYAHFGEGYLNESHLSFDASRLFSALFLEALKMDKEKEFFQLCASPNFRMSDAFPYIDEPFVPKPIGYPKHHDQINQNLKKVRQEAKKVKRIQYLPISKLDDFLKQQANLQELSDNHKKIGSVTTTTKKGEDPFEVGVTRYNTPLYIIASENALFNQLMESLQYSGLGGKRTSGYGRFELAILPLPEKLEQRLKEQPSSIYLLMTTSFPQESELVASMEGAHYLIKKSSGFVYSESSREQLRKKDLYRFKAGSTFEKTYTGSIIDVRPDKFPHPVWNYSKSLFLNLGK